MPRPGLALTLTLTLGLTLTACPGRRPPEPAVDPDARPVVHPTLVRAWSDLPADPYPELAEGPADLERVRRGHDVWRWTETRARWGELDVLQFEDTDRPTTATGAVAGWLLGEEQRVTAVVLRDFVASPQAASWQELLLSLGEVWPAPFEVCAPKAPGHATSVVAIPAGDRRKLSLVPSEGQEAWMVDHVEYLAAGTDRTLWWERKGYGGCESLGTLLPDGRLKPPKPSDDKPATEAP